MPSTHVDRQPSSPVDGSDPRTRNALTWAYEWALRTRTADQASRSSIATAGGKWWSLRTIHWDSTRACASVATRPRGRDVHETPSRPARQLDLR
jgi:hypothetical protein